MLNKKGQIFSLYIVFITLFMIGVVVSLYFIQQQNVQGMVISPMRVLNERDNLEAFERHEMDLIKKSLKSASGTFCTQEFIESFRHNFFSDFGYRMKSFLTWNVYKNGVKLNVDVEGEIDNGVYPPIKTSCSGNTLFFTRDKLYKEFKMDSEYAGKRIVFPVGFYFEFERQYNIKKINDDFEVGFS